MNCVTYSLLHFRDSRINNKPNDNHNDSENYSFHGSELMGE
jgi:hypothetical protein